MENHINSNFEIDRTRYDHYNIDQSSFKTKKGINEQVVIEISKQKNEPKWMLEKRLESLRIFNELNLPKFGPDLSELNLEDIFYYIKPDAKKNVKVWDDVPKDIKNTFDMIGVLDAEKKSLAGVGGQYDSEVIYHNLKEEWNNQGIIFLDLDEALIQHEELVKKYFMTSCVKPNLHKFSALHGAVWSGGTFIYIPKGVKLKLPLQAYFRMNAKKAGQFEHTLIIVEEDAELQYIEGCSAPKHVENSIHAGCVEIFVEKRARMRYSSIENWSKNTYNLNTKRAIVGDYGVMEWVNGNMGSKVTMLYPTSILLGDNSSSDFIGVAYAGEGQHQDTGCKVHHIGKNTKSNIISKSISKDSGITTYRGEIRVDKTAKKSLSNIKCDTLMMDHFSKSNTLPNIESQANDSEIAHEATVGKISEEQIFYLMSRGINEDAARQLIVSGFIEPIVKELPLEYAVELNRLIKLETGGRLG